MPTRQNVHRAADVWVHPQTNEVFVADGYGNHRVIGLRCGHRRVQADVGRIRQQAGGRRPLRGRDSDELSRCPGPQNFSIVHAIRVAKDGTVYVADRENRRVQMFTNDGKFVKQLVKTNTPFARDLALSPDAGAAVPLRRRRQGYCRSSIARRSRSWARSSGPGMIGGGHQIATDSKGNIYIAQTGHGMQKLTFKGMSSLVSR